MKNAFTGQLILWQYVTLLQCFPILCNICCIILEITEIKKQNRMREVSVFGVFLARIRTIKTPNTGNSHAVIHIDTKLCNIWSSGVTLIKENKLYFWLRKRHQNKHYLLQFSKIKIWTLPKIISNNGINIFCRIAPKCDKYFQ